VVGGVAFAELVKRVGDFLQQRGFEGRGPVFFRVRAGNWALIALQKSQKTSADAIVFTVNVGVVSERLARFFSIPLMPNRPPEAGEWHWRQRLGFLLPEGLDKWWTIKSNTRIEEVSREVERALELALPEVEKHIRDEFLRDLWLTGRSPGLTEVQRLKNLAVLLKALGPEDRVTPILDELRRVSRANAMLVEQKLQAGASV
jgi:hypothetical protein